MHMYTELNAFPTKISIAAGGRDLIDQSASERYARTERAKELAHITEYLDSIIVTRRPSDQSCIMNGIIYYVG